MKYRKLNKSAVSLMISYVLLISIVLALSVGVFSWLKIMANIEPTIDCKDDTSLVITDYKCTPDQGIPTTSNLKLELKNNGRFNIDGVIVTVEGESDTFPIQYLAPDSQGGIMNGHYYFSSPLEPQADKTIGFRNQKYNGNNLEPITFKKIEKIEIQPFIIQKGDKFERILCKNAIKKIPLEDCTIFGDPTTITLPINIPEPLVHWELNDANYADTNGDNNWRSKTGNIPEINTGLIDNALYFNGAEGDHLKIRPAIDESKIKNKIITISTLIKKTSPTTNREGIIKRGLNDNDPIKQEYSLYIENNKAHFSIGDGANSISVTGGTITENQWHSIVGIVTPSSIIIYTDGNPTSQTYTSSFNILSDSIIQNLGSLNNEYDNSFTGLIDEVKIWDDILSEAQIKKQCQDYNICN